MSTAAATKSGTEDISALKRCLQAVGGIPIEAAISKFGAGLTRQQAEFLRTLTDEDINNLRKTEDRMFEALGESGGGCGVYN